MTTNELRRLYAEAINNYRSVHGDASEREAWDYITGTGDGGENARDLLLAVPLLLDIVEECPSVGSASAAFDEFEFVPHG